MAFTKEQLMELKNIILECSDSMTIMVPSTDYYARRGDTEEYKLKYIDAWKIEDLLNRMIDDAE